MANSSILFDKIHDYEHKLDNGLVALAFSALGLSVQFSPKMGHVWPWLLILSWSLMFASAFLGGWRLISRPEGLMWDMDHSEALEGIEKLEDPNYQAALESRDYGVVRSAKYAAHIATLRRKASHAEDEGSRWEQRARFRFKWQIWLLVAGLAANGVFSAANYLRSVPDHVSGVLTELYRLASSL